MPCVLPGADKETRKLEKWAMVASRRILLTVNASGCVLVSGANEGKRKLEKWAVVASRRILVTVITSECALLGAEARPAVDDCGTLGTVSKSLQRHTCYKKRIVRPLVLLSLWVNFQA